jgi:two-component system OmpR family sensor kinase
VSRLPIRLRLTLAFALAMALVLGAVGALLYARLADSLEEQLDESLRVRAAALSALVLERGGDVTGPALTSEGDEDFAQVLGPDGSLIASSPSVAGGPFVSKAEVEQARAGRYFLRRDDVAALDDEPARVLVAPIGVRFLVVGASLEDREEALEGLVAELFVVGPIALALASVLGYLLAAAAFRPVEAMRSRAAEISTDRPGRRLPLPRARDEIHRLGETLNAMLSRLEAAFARERRFVADASHELRTPLALLRTELELALRRPRSARDLEDALRSAAEEVDRLSSLAEDLLVLARVDEGALPVRRSPIEAVELLDTVARRFAARAADEGRTLEVADAGDAPLAADRARLEQALGNLVDNALRYGAGTIRLDARRHDGHVELRVGDEGPGFPPEFLPRAFERFTRADEARGRGAAGLGLAIVDAIARAHGGTAEAANKPGTGALVWLTLPTEAAERQPNAP